MPGKRKLKAVGDGAHTEQKKIRSDTKVPRKSQDTNKLETKSKTSKGGNSEKLSTNPKKVSHPKHVAEDAKAPKEETIEYTEDLPKCNSKGQLVFSDWPDFRPNMTPKEVIQAGSFGGTYFRPIYSSITKQKYSGVWKELPKEWLEGLNIAKQISSATYHTDVNTYKAKCGGSLEMWEESGWMHPEDPYGWFQWYCRFYRGRRTDDDDRQVGRWLRCAGVKGRWKNNLITKCINSGCAYDNIAISPVVRQTLQHWGYRLTKEDFDAYAKKKQGK